MKVYIDGDACPVIRETITISHLYNLDVVIICDAAHVIKRDGAQTICVSTGKDSVDFKLVNLISENDIVITQDYGLAAMSLSKKAYVMNQNGLEYCDENIDALLHSRYVSAKVRKSGGRVKGPKKRTPELTREFERSFNQLCSRILSE